MNTHTKHSPGNLRTEKNPTGTLTEVDFGLAPGRMDGTPVISDETMAKARALFEAQQGRPMEADDEELFEFAARAQFETVQDRDYFLFPSTDSAHLGEEDAHASGDGVRNEIVLNRRSDGMPMRNKHSGGPGVETEETISSSRLQSRLGQMVDAKHGIDGVPMGDGGESEASVNVAELLSHFRIVRGISGTADLMEDVFVTLGYGEVMPMDRFAESGLEKLANTWAPTKDAKWEELADRAKVHSAAGNPVLIRVDSPDEIGPIVAKLKERGIEPQVASSPAIAAADDPNEFIERITQDAGRPVEVGEEVGTQADVSQNAGASSEAGEEAGADWGAEEASALGPVTIGVDVIMRGNDYSSEILGKPFRLLGSGYSSAAGEINDRQFEGRGSRPDQHGPIRYSSVEYFVSPEDLLFDQPHDVAVVERYKAAVAADEAAPTAETQAALMSAEEEMNGLIPGLKAEVALQLRRNLVASGAVAADAAPTEWRTGGRNSLPVQHIQYINRAAHHESVVPELPPEARADAPSPIADVPRALPGRMRDTYRDLWAVRNWQYVHAATAIAGLSPASQAAFHGWTRWTGIDAIQQALSSTPGTADDRLAAYAALDAVSAYNDSAWDIAAIQAAADRSDLAPQLQAFTGAVQDWLAARDALYSAAASSVQDESSPSSDPTGNDEPAGGYRAYLAANAARMQARASLLEAVQDNDVSPDVGDADPGRDDQSAGAETGSEDADRSDSAAEDDPALEGSDTDADGAPEEDSTKSDGSDAEVDGVPEAQSLTENDSTATAFNELTSSVATWPALTPVLGEFVAALHAAQARTVTTQQGTTQSHNGAADVAVLREFRKLLTDLSADTLTRLERIIAEYARAHAETVPDPDALRNPDGYPNELDRLNPDGPPGEGTDSSRDPDFADLAQATVDWHVLRSGIELVGELIEPDSAADPTRSGLLWSHAQRLAEWLAARLPVMQLGGTRERLAHPDAEVVAALMQRQATASAALSTAQRALGHLGGAQTVAEVAEASEHGSASDEAPDARTDAELESDPAVAEGDPSPSAAASAVYGVLRAEVAAAASQAEARWRAAVAALGVDPLAVDPDAVRELQDAAFEQYVLADVNRWVSPGAPRQRLEAAMAAVGVDLDAARPLAAAAVRELYDAAVRHHEAREWLDRLDLVAGLAIDPASKLAYAQAVLARVLASERFDRATADLPEDVVRILRSPADRLFVFTTLSLVISGGRDDIVLTPQQRVELYYAVAEYHNAGTEAVAARWQLEAEQDQTNGSAGPEVSYPARLRRLVQQLLPSRTESRHTPPAAAATTDLVNRLFDGADIAADDPRQRNWLAEIALELLRTARRPAADPALVGQARRDAVNSALATQVRVLHMLAQLDRRGPRLDALHDPAESNLTPEQIAEIAALAGRLGIEPPDSWDPNRWRSELTRVHRDLRAQALRLVQLRTDSGQSRTPADTLGYSAEFRRYQLRREALAQLEALLFGDVETREPLRDIVTRRAAERDEARARLVDESDDVAQRATAQAIAAAAGPQQLTQSDLTTIRDELASLHDELADDQVFTGPAAAEIELVRTLLDLVTEALRTSSFESARSVADWLVARYRLESAVDPLAYLRAEVGDCDALFWFGPEAAGLILRIVDALAAVDGAETTRRTLLVALGEYQAATQVFDVVDVAVSLPVVSESVSSDDALADRAARARAALEEQARRVEAEAFDAVHPAVEVEDDSVGETSPDTAQTGPAASRFAQSLESATSVAQIPGDGSVDRIPAMDGVPVHGDQRDMSAIADTLASFPESLDRLMGQGTYAQLERWVLDELLPNHPEERGIPLAALVALRAFGCGLFTELDAVRGSDDPVYLADRQVFEDVVTAGMECMPMYRNTAGWGLEVDESDVAALLARIPVGALVADQALIGMDAGMPPRGNVWFVLNSRRARDLRLFSDSTTSRTALAYPPGVRLEAGIRYQDDGVWIVLLKESVNAAAEPVESPIPPAGYVRGRDLLRELDYRTLTTLDSTDAATAGDGILGGIYRQQGFDGLPTMVGLGVIDAIVAGGGREFFRGVTEPGYVAQFRTGRYFPGRSVFGVDTGNGTYVTTSGKVALHYAEERPNGVIRMALRPDARKGDLATIVREQQHVLNLRMEERANLFGIERPTYEVIARIDALNDQIEVLGDVGRFASATGDYDAYRTDAGYLGEDDEYWVILNRTALVVEDAPTQAPTSQVEPTDGDGQAVASDQGVLPTGLMRLRNLVAHWRQQAWVALCHRATAGATSDQNSPTDEVRTYNRLSAATQFIDQLAADLDAAITSSEPGSRLDGLAATVTGLNALAESIDQARSRLRALSAGPERDSASDELTRLWEQFDAACAPSTVGLTYNQCDPLLLQQVKAETGSGHFGTLDGVGPEGVTQSAHEDAWSAGLQEFRDRDEVAAMVRDLAESMNVSRRDGVFAVVVTEL
ncbi:hypothetical protein ABZW16_42215, partial [Nocardia sp. NPDC004604]